MRMLPGRAGRPLRFLAVVYVDVFRAIPGDRRDLPRRVRPLRWPGADPSRTSARPGSAILALTLTYGAYVAEVYRAGIESMHPSQGAAARSLGLIYPQTLRTVLIPQAVRRVIPPLLNDFIGLQKDTALLA